MNDLERRWNDVDPREEALHDENLPLDIDYRDRDVVPLDWDVTTVEDEELLVLLRCAEQIV